MGDRRRDRHVLLVIGCLSALASIPGYADTRCLADPHSATTAEYGYKVRGQRCEGELKNFVGLSDGISLIGYHEGPITIDLRSSKPLTIEAVGDSNDQVFLRALSVTSIARYQMDEEVVPLGRPVEWPVDVLQQAAKGAANHAIDVSTIALTACSRRCADIADTEYWPVRAVSPSPSDRGLALLVRSAIRAVNVTAVLTSTDGKAITVTPGHALNANLITAIRLPTDIRPGRYRLAITAVDYESRAPLPPFNATIIVPKEMR